MGRERRELRAAKLRKKADAKRIRRVRRDERKTELNMTVVNAVIGQRNSEVSLNDVISVAVQQTHAALLYADKVTLVSPSVALMQSADDVGNRVGVDLLLELAKVAPKYFPDAAKELLAFKRTIDNLPPRAQWSAREQREYELVVVEASKQFSPISDKLRKQAHALNAQTGFDQLQLAVDAGILSIERMAGVDVSAISDGDDTMVLGYLDRIQKLFDTRNEYPLFDANASSIVSGGLEMGIFTRTPVAKRLGQHALMADGLFDRLPLFPYASTSEILDIRTELSPALGAFRAGVSRLTENIDVAAEDPNFGEEIEQAWNTDVAPALDEIEATIKSLAL
ncbi:hypothetical protein SAMN04489835_1221 [Mycolicibacterium rutilum]|uniref:Uncharacterized protein n=1 Tax=Mycolicibacterium rutilum TaxID=370526 RepID=A0A1H6J161_MYCRU|nr:hypothetical protein [Mycolicibacterium rutilum]SEH54304.1 hypothetical protein SAMN04489835_1221 [Mycolicibacterium rutilum]